MSPSHRGAPKTCVQRVRRGVWLCLAACALAIAALGATRDERAAPPASLYSSIALCLAAGSILTRRAARSAVTMQRLARSLPSPLLAGGLGALGLVVAVREGAILVGLLYTLAGALLSLGQPGSPAEARTPAAPGGRPED